MATVLFDVFRFNTVHTEHVVTTMRWNASTSRSRELSIIILYRTSKTLSNRCIALLPWLSKRDYCLDEVLFVKAKMTAIEIGFWIDSQDVTGERTGLCRCTGGSDGKNYSAVNCGAVDVRLVHLCLSTDSIVVSRLRSSPPCFHLNFHRLEELIKFHRHFSFVLRDSIQ